MKQNLRTSWCPRCEKNVCVKEFGKDATTAKGISSWCKLCKRTWRAAHRKKYPEKAKIRDFENDLKKHYGKDMTAERYWAMDKAQDSKCAICGKHRGEQIRNLNVDHCAKTKIIRELLCSGCNPGLGYFQHSIPLLQAAIKYLKKWERLSAAIIEDDRHRHHSESGSIEISQNSTGNS